jgi:hypothetical protein
LSRKKSLKNLSFTRYYTYNAPFYRHFSGVLHESSAALTRYLSKITLEGKQPRSKTAKYFRQLTSLEILESDEKIDKILTTGAIFLP